jgi:hypothetical protein
VASRSTEDSLRVFNGKTRYDEWLFLAGQPRIVGRPLQMQQPGVGLPGAPGMPGAPPGLNAPATPLPRPGERGRTRRQ